MFRRLVCLVAILLAGAILGGSGIATSAPTTLPNRASSTHDELGNNLASRSGSAGSPSCSGRASVDDLSSVGRSVSAFNLGLDCAEMTAFAAHTTPASAAGFAETRVGASDQISATGTGVSLADFVDTQRGSDRSYDETAVGDLFATDAIPGLTNAEIRASYLGQVSQIGEADQALAAQGATLQQRAEAAFELRQSALNQARSLMDPAEAATLPPGKTLQDLIQKAQGSGLSGDQIWQQIIDSSTRTNPSVNQSLGFGS